MGTPFFIPAYDVFAQLGRADAPLVIDVRRPEIVEASNEIMPAARIRTPSEAVAEALLDDHGGRLIVVTCAHGHNRSQQVVARLRATCAAPTRTGSIWRRNAPACWQWRSAYRRSMAMTITPSCGTASSSTTRSIRGCARRGRSAITGRGRPPARRRDGLAIPR